MVGVTGLKHSQKSNPPLGGHLLFSYSEEGDAYKADGGGNRERADESKQNADSTGKSQHDLDK